MILCNLYFLFSSLSRQRLPSPHVSLLFPYLLLLVPFFLAFSPLHPRFLLLTATHPHLCARFLLLRLTILTLTNRRHQFHSLSYYIFPVAASDYLPLVTFECFLSFLHVGRLEAKNRRGYSLRCGSLDFHPTVFHSSGATAPR